MTIIGGLVDAADADHESDHQMIALHVRAFYAECDVPRRDHYDRRRSQAYDRAAAEVRDHLTRHHASVDVPDGAGLETLRTIHEGDHRP